MSFHPFIKFAVLPTSMPGGVKPVDPNGIKPIIMNQSANPNSQVPVGGIHPQTGGAAAGPNGEPIDPQDMQKATDEAQKAKDQATLANQQLKLTQQIQKHQQSLSTAHKSLGDSYFNTALNSTLGDIDKLMGAATQGHIEHGFKAAADTTATTRSGKPWPTGVSYQPAAPKPNYATIAAQHGVKPDGIPTLGSQAKDISGGVLQAATNPLEAVEESKHLLGTDKRWTWHPFDPKSYKPGELGYGTAEALNSVATGVANIPRGLANWGLNLGGLAGNTMVQGAKGNAEMFKAGPEVWNAAGKGLHLDPSKDLEHTKAMFKHTGGALASGAEYAANMIPAGKWLPFLGKIPGMGKFFNSVASVPVLSALGQAGSDTLQDAGSHAESGVKLSPQQETAAPPSEAPAGEPTLTNPEFMTWLTDLWKKLQPYLADSRPQEMLRALPSQLGAAGHQVRNYTPFLN